VVLVVKVSRAVQVALAFKVDQEARAVPVALVVQEVLALKVAEVENANVLQVRAMVNLAQTSNETK
jgi:hypothetical protein